SNRKDGFGAKDEINNNPSAIIDNASKSKKLTRIDLYTKKDWYADPDNAVPLKSVHFVYKYSLCKNIHNNNQNTNVDGITELSNKFGKLMLYKIYFTYGNNNKGILSPYIFNYSDFNPNYSLRDYDRWGNYKQDGISGLPNSEFPYTHQDKALADTYAGAWNLTEIIQPSGGKIKITYESDDYAYVQDRQAMRMFKALGAGNSSSFSNSSDLFSSNGSSKPFIYFRLDPADYGLAGNKIHQKYIGNHEQLYFKFFVNLTDANNYEYVNGYAEIESAGATNDSTIGYVKIKSVNVGDRENNNKMVNPISKAAWQFARINLPFLVYPGSNTIKNNASAGLEDLFSMLWGCFNDLKNMFAGFNNSLMNDGFGKVFNKDKSWIRLLEPDRIKYGGGARVKKIEQFDNWSLMTNEEQSASYGQIYDYSEYDSGTDEIISSGVAAYEPLIGGDENPFRMPISFTEKAALAPNNDYYVETPLGECFFPGPSVGYKKVTVKNISHAGITRHATGKSVHEFYTAYDFPTLTDDTGPVTPLITKNQPYDLFSGFESYEYVSASQGYTVELNDMHGKPKAVWQYEEGAEEPFSGLEYYYKKDNTMNKYLDNKVKVINKDGSVTSAKTMGEEIDMVADMNEKDQKDYRTGLMVNTDGFVLWVIPITIPMGLPRFSSSHNTVRTSVVTKVINRYGILEKTVAHKNGASVSTENLAFDAETGEALLTRTQNEYGDPVYDFTYPAHWVYNGMEPAYKNSNAVLDIGFNSSDSSLTGTLISLLVPGDEIKISDSQDKFWIYEKNNALFILDFAGEKFYSSGETIEVMRSGHRNMQTVPAGKMICLRNPANAITNINNNYKIINADATEYSGRWDAYCTGFFAQTATVNPYVLGIAGNWKQKKAHKYITKRKQTDNNGNTDIQVDGTYKNFSAFWKYNTFQNRWEKDTTGWLWTAEVTKYSPYGFETENRDILGNYSCAHYGYNNSLPVSVAYNAQYRETFFDAWEEAEFSSTTCEVAENVFHTGNNCLKVSNDMRFVYEFALNSCKCNPSVPIPSYYEHCCGIQRIPSLKPITGKEYIVSCWARKDNPADNTIVPKIQIRIY
ncbi:MAG: hypothetical protein KJ607_12900, partial [Bacteroidetes bacterium]|nr:hypothetical protein [Bacteroidota bacterium]